MKARLSQHFLFDPSILGRIVDVSGIGPEDTVVEIGPGPGSLTRMLLQRAGKVVAIELDERLYGRLREELVSPKLDLVLGDCLKYPYHELGEFRVVANIPYHITTPIIFRLLREKALRSMTLTIQKEVAQRIAAAPGSGSYGVLSLAVQYRAAPKLAFVIPKGAFRPVPKVDSACIHLEIYGRPRVQVDDEGLLFGLIRGAFAQRRKTMENGIRRLCAAPRDALLRAGIDPKRRPETLSLEDFARLADEVLRGGRAG
ncbi:MAG: 16S rRNA (adenine(1518)-N(6)/adenine(1519)-N(6))-dimethyltransferase RsmA [Nitrospiraceae bacterium]|nr:16S rRNA (adenine(1518)-N(6)/adenine(1519)-N(6))-dimethyltransferase RsmA [Nitrospiraceae bacterium]